jgi:hypothetical protein
MKATYTLRPEELNEDFLHTLRETVKGQGESIELTARAIGKLAGMDTTD